jgi:cytoskeletal protein RodZ
MEKREEKGKKNNSKLRKLKSKRAIELEMLGWWIIAIVILVILVIAYVVLRAKGSSALDFIQNLFRFGK